MMDTTRTTWVQLLTSIQAFLSVPGQSGTGLLNISPAWVRELMRESERQCVMSVDNYMMPTQKNVWF